MINNESWLELGLCRSPLLFIIPQFYSYFRGGESRNSSDLISSKLSSKNQVVSIDAPYIFFLMSVAYLLSAFRFLALWLILSKFSFRILSSLSLITYIYPIDVITTWPIIVGSEPQFVDMIKITGLTAIKILLYYMIKKSSKYRIKCIYANRKWIFLLLLPDLMHTYTESGVRTYPLQFSEIIKVLAGIGNNKTWLLYDKEVN
jgi:hypothetical protein